MHYLSRALEWVRAVLFGPRRPGRHSCLYAAPAVEQRPQAHHPSPERWDAVLARARHRRALNAAPPAAMAVRLYVLSPEERERALCARRDRAAS